MVCGHWRRQLYSQALHHQQRALYRDRDRSFRHQLFGRRPLPTVSPTTMSSRPSISMARGRTPRKPARRLSRRCRQLRPAWLPSAAVGAVTLTWNASALATNYYIKRALICGGTLHKHDRHYHCNKLRGHQRHQRDDVLLCGFGCKRRRRERQFIRSECHTSCSAPAGSETGARRQPDHFFLARLGCELRPPRGH